MRLIFASGSPAADLLRLTGNDQKPVLPESNGLQTMYTACPRRIIGGRIMPARDITGLKGRFLQLVLSRRFEGVDGYLLAILAVAIAFAIRFSLQGFLDEKAIFILFVPAILVASIAGGIGPGLLAVLL
eukprot:gene27991-36880_t